MVYRIVKEVGNCCFQEFSKEDNRLNNCHKPSIVKSKNGYICNEHLKHALIADKNSSYFNKNGAEIIYTSDFIKTAKGIKITDVQYSLF